MRRTLGMLFVAALSSAAFSQTASTDWIEAARRLTGESAQVHEESKKKLQAYPDLENALRASLVGPYRALALDVIATLRLHALLPDLLELSKQDLDGFSYLAANALITQENVLRVAQTYLERLRRHRETAVSPPSKVVMLDTLGRMQVAMEPALVENLFADKSYEVRSAALSYMRALILKKNETRYLPIVAKALEASPYQLRVQALYVIESIGTTHRSRFAEALNGCRDDPSRPVREGCDMIRGQSL